MSICTRRCGSVSKVRFKAGRASAGIMEKPLAALPISANPRQLRDTVTSALHGNSKAVDHAPNAVAPANLGSGRPLEPGIKSQMESQFGYDFTRVRVHADDAAAASARELRAKAFTVGADIAFAATRFSPGTESGYRLLAHELAHVVQQSRGGESPRNDTNSVHETAAAAAAAAQRVAGDGWSDSSKGQGPFVRVAGATGVGVARAADDRDESTNSKEKINKADAQLERLHAHARSKGAENPLTPEETVAAYDAVSSAVAHARASKDAALIADADRLTRRFASITEGSSEANNTLTLRQHPAADKGELGAEDAFIKNTAQRGWDVAPPAFMVGESRSAIDQLEEELKKGPTKKREKQIRKEIDSLRRRISISTPTLKKPDALPAQYAALQKKLTTENDPAKRAALDAELVRVEQRLAQPVPLSDLRSRSFGVGQSTYVLIQIVGPPPKMELIDTLMARNEPPRKNRKGVVVNPGRHAEVVVLDKLRALPRDVKLKLRGASLVIQGDQEVCDKCIPAVHGFSDDHGMLPPIAKTAHLPALTSTGEISKLKSGAAETTQYSRAKTTVKNLSVPDKIDKIEQAMRKEGTLKEGERIPLRYQRQPVPRPPKKDSPDGSSNPGQGPSGGTVAPASKLISSPVMPDKKPQRVPTAAKPPAIAPLQIPSPPAVSRPAALPRKAPAQISLPAKPPKGAALRTISPSAPTPSAPAAGPSKTTRQVALEQHAQIVSGVDQSGIGAKIGASAQQDRGHGISTGQSAAFDGQINVDVKPIPNSYPVQYRVKLTLDLSGGASLSATHGEQGASERGVALAASGSLVISYVHTLSAEQANQYRAAALSGGHGDFAELRIARAVAQGRFVEAKAAIEADRKSPILREGDEADIVAKGQVGADASATINKAGGPGAGVTAGVTRGGKVQVHVAIVNGQAVYTVTVEGDRGWHLGASGSLGAAGGGYAHSASETNAQTVSFVVDPGDSALRAELAAISSLAELQSVIAKHPNLAAAQTVGHSNEVSGTVSAGVGGIGLGIEQGTGTSQETTIDASGVTHTYSGHGTLGGSATAFGHTVSKSTVTDTFSATVGPDKKVSGESSAAKTETDYGKSARQLGTQLENRPLQTVAGLVTGGTKVLQDSTDVKGKKLNNQSFARLSSLAEDATAWSHAWKGEYTGNLYAWNAIRGEIRDAKGDNDAIAAILARYEGGDSGRSSIVERAVGNTGIRFEFPDELADKKPEFEQLVVSDPVSHARELAANGSKADALTALNDAASRLSRLMQAIQSHEGDFTDPAATAEMMSRIGKRQTEIRSAIRDLSDKPREPSAKAVAAPGASKTTQSVEQAAPERAPAKPDADEIARREERNAKIATYIPACLTLRNTENAVFAVIEDEYASKWTRPDLILVSKKLNVLKQETYPTWDGMVNELRSVFVERGESSGRADQYAPNRDRWNALYDKGFKSGY